MKIPQMIAAEFRRLTATRLAVVALFALLLIPVLYGGLYLWANQDPYARLNHIPVALVVADTGATVDNAPRNYGTEVASGLVKDNAFDWRLVTAAEAKRGVDNSKYDFSLTLPKDFSAALASAAGTNPHQARVELTTNDANSYLSTTIGEQAVKTLKATIVERVNREAANQFLVAISDIRSKLTDAADGASQLVDGATTATNGATALAAGAAQLASGAGAANAGAQNLSAGAAALSSGAQSVATGATTAATGAATLTTGAQQVAAGATTLSTSAQTLAAGAGRIAAGNAALATQADAVGSKATAAVATLGDTRAAVDAALTAAGIGADGLAAIDAQLDTLGASLTADNTTLQAAVGQIDQLSAGSAAVSSGSSALAAGAGTLATGAGSVASGTAALASGTATLATGATSVASGGATLATGAASLASGTATLASGTGQLATSSSQLAAGLSTLDSGASTLTDGLNAGVASIPASSAASRSAQSDTIASPLDVKNTAVTAAGNYGAGLAPFFVSLAGWIGIYALFLIVKPVSRRAITALHSPLRVTLAGWLTPGILGAVQMAGLFFVLARVLGFPMSNPVGVYGIMLLASMTFAAMILALNVWFGSVGQFLGLVLMVLQLVTAGGTFPWQTLPPTLATLHHILPMSAAVDAMRQLMYGGNLTAAGGDVLTLAYWLIGGLLVSAVGVTRMTHFRTLRDLQPSLIG